MAYHALQKNILPVGEYGIYLRKSRADLEAESHGEGETLLRHEKLLYEMADKFNIHISPDGIYREIVSGETIEARPEMQRLLNDVMQGRWKGILVVEIERLARGDTSDQGTVAKAFKLSSTKIITPSKTYDPDNEFDEEYFEFGLFMSRREFKTINRRIQRGRIASAKEGKYLASVPPYGYDKVKIKNDKGYTLAKNDENPFAEIMFKALIYGVLQEDGSVVKMGCTRISDYLNSIGCKPRIGEEWTKSSVVDILHNPVYAGMIRWGYRKEVKYIENGKVRKRRSKNTSDCIFVKGLHPATITWDEFLMAQDILDSNTRSSVPGNKVLKNPFAGIIYCGKCGKLMTRLSKSKKTPYDTIKCMNKKCDNVSSPLYSVEEVLIKSLRVWLKNFKIEWDTKKLDKPYSHEIKTTEIIIEQINSNIIKLNEQKDRIHNLLEQGVYSVEVFQKRNDKIFEQIDECEDNLTKHKKQLKKLGKQAECNDIFIPKAENILDNYYDLETASIRNEALKEILEKVEYVKNEPNKKGNRDNANFELALYPKILKF